METNCHCLFCPYISQFKSYYVVWKLCNEVRDEGICEQFKSYYVVWKQFFPANLVVKKLKFKSYYVVWKLLPPKTTAEQEQV